MRTPSVFLYPFTLSILLFVFALLAGCELSPPNSIETEKEVVKLEFSPPLNTFPRNSQLTLHARAYFADSSYQHVSSQARWFSTDPEVLEINNNGTVTTYKAGISTISVSLGTHSISKNVRVSDATPEFVRVELESFSVRPNMPFTLSVYAYFSDGSKLDVTNDINWHVVNNDIEDDTDIIVRTFDNNFRSLVLGEGRITANYHNDAYNHTLVIAVNEAGLNKIRIPLLPKTYFVGSSVPLEALGYYSDDTVLDISQNVSWTVTAITEDELGNPIQAGSATIDQFNSSMRFLEPGKIRITASLDNAVETRTLTIKSANLKAIEIEPTANTIFVDEHKKLNAYAIYDSGDTYNISDSVSWASSVLNIADVSNINQFIANIYAADSGTTIISASYNQFFENELEVSVNDSTLDSLEIVSPNTSYALTTAARLKAVGHYSDGSSHDISELVTWGSADETVIKIGNTGSNAGKLEALKADSVEVSAKFKNKSTSLILTISDEAALTEITLQSDAGILYLDDTQATVTATAVFDDDTSQDITELVTWQSSNNSSLFVGNHPQTKGRLTPLDTGLIVITASYNGISQDKTFTISDATLLNFSINTPEQNLSTAAAFQLTATANYSDGEIRDITEKVYWTSSDQEIATISNIPGMKGQVTARNTTAFSISASYETLSQTVTLTASE